MSRLPIEHFVLISFVALAGPVLADEDGDAQSLFHSFTPNKHVAGAPPAPGAPQSGGAPFPFPPATHSPQAAPAAPVAPSAYDPATGQFNDADYEWDEFVPFNGVRHDEFDWGLLKNFLIKNEKNTMISPFLVKLLLSILTEAAGRNTSTYRELALVLPSIQTIFQARELYVKTFNSLLVS